MTTRPFPKICIALGLPYVKALLEHAQREIENGESFLEFRLDYLDRPLEGAAAIREFLDRFPECFILATCRRRHNNGKFDGSIENQLAILQLAIESGAHAVDIEIETAEVVPDRISALRERARILVSWHNFEATPPLEPVLRRLARIPADGCKIVGTARKPSDIARVIEVARAHSRVPTVVLAMGEIGFPSRILSLPAGGAFTYAAPSSFAGTAPGQITARLLRKQYRADRLTRAAKIYCVIADPVLHSLSPVIHNRAFQLRRLDCVYLPMLVARTALRDFLKLADELPITGFSVTIPHKQRIMRYVDHIDPLARRIGAVNTVWRKAGKWRGANTDAPAVVKPLEKHLRLRGSRILVAGSGGAARSAACSIADAGGIVSVTGRNADRVRALARLAGGVALSREAAEASRFDAVVHATPLGTYPNTEVCFFENVIPADLVFDMVYNPMDTLLLRRAREQGKQVIPGIKMFIEQAVAQFEIWTGETAPRAAMEKAALDALDLRNAAVVE